MLGAHDKFFSKMSMISTPGVLEAEKILETECRQFWWTPCIKVGFYHSKLVTFNMQLIKQKRGTTNLQFFYFQSCRLYNPEQPSWIWSKKANLFYLFQYKTCSTLGLFIDQYNFVRYLPFECVQRNYYWLHQHEYYATMLQ